jgi:ABC-type lipoprotein release transport system permease subunit
VSWISVFAGPVVIFASVALSGIVPFRRIRRLEPVAAMREG